MLYMNVLSYISDVLIRTNAKFWSQKNSDDVRMEINYNFRKNYIEDLILSGKFWGGVTSEKYINQDIVVSLTTYGQRLNYVHLAIASIMLQTTKANRIILWLGEELRGQDLPEMLKRLQQYGLEIYYTRDIRSYTKLIPALKLCPEDAIITIDDDAIYDVCVLEHLIKAHLRNPNCIYGSRCHKIVVKDSIIVPYVDWDWTINTPEESLLILPTGVGGVLYPPNSLDGEVFNEDVFLTICPTTDDIWFKVMSLKKGSMTGKTPSTNPSGEDYFMSIALDNTGLKSINWKNDVNGNNMRALLSKYEITNLRC